MRKSGRNGAYRRRRAGEIACHPLFMRPSRPAPRTISWLHHRRPDAAKRRPRRGKRGSMKSLDCTVNAPFRRRRETAASARRGPSMTWNCRSNAGDWPDSALSPRADCRQMASPRPISSPLPSGPSTSAQEGQGEGVATRPCRRRWARGQHPHPTLSRRERASDWERALDQERALERSTARFVLPPATQPRSPCAFRRERASPAPPRPA
jgi:hypothetical protein